jgi:nucleoside phosphorylase
VSRLLKDVLTYSGSKYFCLCTRKLNDTTQIHTLYPFMMSGQSVSTPLTHEDYTIGWVCALSKEGTAARAMLEVERPKLIKPMGDPNGYRFGSIGKHNIVIGTLPKGKIGTNPAATVATAMLTTFTSIKFLLLVGIGGGVPLKVRLGDVVVSTPLETYPGVVQWDMGKKSSDGKFIRTGALQGPEFGLLTALSQLMSDHEMKGSKIPEYLTRMGKDWPQLAAKYLKHDTLQDVLYRPEYSHVKSAATNEDIDLNRAGHEKKDGVGHEEGDEGEEEKNKGDEWVIDKGENDGEEEEYDEEKDVESCKHCDKTKEVKRKGRDMKVHYGLIASGNSVIKDAQERDKINKDLGGNVLCFEMEAAGILTNRPCLVIRGICDYADTHKNKAWQEHAAAVAAAFAKEFLHELDPQDVQDVEELPVIKGT